MYVSTALNDFCIKCCFSVLTKKAYLFPLPSNTELSLCSNCAHSIEVGFFVVVMEKYCHIFWARFLKEVDFFHFSKTQDTFIRYFLKLNCFPNVCVCPAKTSQLFNNS